MGYNFDEIIDRHGTRCFKWDVDCDHRPLAPDALSMWIADMDFAVAPPITAALHRVADRRIYGYTDNSFEAYYTAVTGYYHRRHNWAIDPAHIVFSQGIVPSLDKIVASLTQPGDGIIIQPPVYPPFSKVTAANGRRVVENPLVLVNGRYEIDFDDLKAKAADPANTMMIFCSPHNPGGRVWTPAEIAQVYAICTENNVLLVSDEIHCDILRAGVRHTPTLALFPDAQNVVVCTAPTKTFNIAGLGASHLVIPNDALRQKVCAAVGEVIINPLTVEAVIAAFTECDDWVDAMNAYVDENLRYFHEALAARLPAVKLPAIEGTYLAWPDISAYTNDTMAYEQTALDAGLCIEAGRRFGTQGEGFLRVNLACPRVYVERAVDILTATLSR